MDSNNKWVPKLKSASNDPVLPSIFSCSARALDNISEQKDPLIGDSLDLLVESSKSAPGKQHANVSSVNSKASSNGSSEWDHKICGVRVLFPHQPYPAQIAFMDKVLKCLNTNQNGLLESPTGSGKSLSLLCSSLAWQTEKQKSVEAAAAQSVTNRKPNIGKCNPPRGSCVSACGKPVENSRLSSNFGMDSDLANDSSSSANYAFTSLKYPGKSKLEPDKTIVHLDDDQDIQIVHETKVIPLRTNLPTQKPIINAVRRRREFGKAKGIQFSDPETDDEDATHRKTPPKIETPNRIAVDSKVMLPVSAQKTCEFTIDGEHWVLDDESFADIDWDTPKSEVYSTVSQSDQTEVPRIFFGSRTHKQITQLVGELRKTAYAKNIRMTVLGSRDQYCIHPDVRGQKNKDDKCSKLLDKKKKHRDSENDFAAWGEGCDFYKGKLLREFSHFDLMRFAVPPAFDVEDLSISGAENSFCPYFASSKLSKDAMLVFCPYQYLIDARIRETREIDLTGQIVIFDEGHNMEDAAREAASFTISTIDLKVVCDDLIRVATHSSMKHNINYLAAIFKTLSGWMVENGSTITGNSEGGSKNYTGPQIIHFLKDLGFGPDRGFQNVCAVVIKDKAKPDSLSSANEAEKEERSTKISGQTLNLLRGMMVILHYLYRDNSKYATDYRVVLQKYVAFTNSYQELPNGFRGKRKNTDESEWSYKLNLWCMNPGVAFGDFAVAKSVVLTSGTLSPLQSFQSELGIKFGVQFEANHVINMNQVWAGGIGRGPHNSSLMAVYKTTQTLVYQDDLGDAILRICKVVPKGVLCFFSSYSLMNTLVNRWKENGFWQAIQAKKKIFEEPRNAGGDKSVFERVMHDYYRAIFGETTEDGQDGALMLAVFRGKISEGLDFSDDKARAVITVGIPYPHFMDEQVVMKKEFNSMNIHRGFLNASTWYDVQAFRALNQALGRCLRHKSDWGALILLDSRFATRDDKYTKSLSKWLRNSIVPIDNFETGMVELERFVKQRLSIGGKSSPSKCCLSEVDFFTDDE